MTKDDQKSSARAKPRAKPLDQDDSDGHDYCDGSDDTDGHIYREDHDDVDDRDDPNGYEDHDDHDDHDNPDDHDDHVDPDGHTDRNDHDDSRDDSLDKEPGCAKILLIQLMSFECILCVLLKGSNTPYSHPTHQHIPITQCTITTILEYIRITHISIARNNCEYTCIVGLHVFMLSCIWSNLRGLKSPSERELRQKQALALSQVSSRQLCNRMK
ncbi:hypothetical protein CAPTEDRAFT_187140, partial [Capitella teleta]